MVSGWANCQYERAYLLGLKFGLLDFRFVFRDQHWADFLPVGAHALAAELRAGS